MEESKVMWSGEVEKRAGWQGFRLWRPRFLTITYHSVLVNKPKTSKSQKLILRRQIVDIHASDLAANPLCFTLIVAACSPLYFRAFSLPDRDAIVMFLKPEITRRESTTVSQVLSLESFLRLNLGSRILLLQRIVLRKYSRTLYAGFVKLRDWEQRSRSVDTEPTSSGDASCLKSL